MRYDPDKHHRRSIRLKDFNYDTAGAYFVTICLQNKLCLLGDVVDEEMQLNDAGEMIKSVLGNLPCRFENIEIDEHIIMPNHIHMVVPIESNSSVGVPLVGTLDRQRTDHVLTADTNANDIADVDDGKRVPTRGTPTTLGDVIGAYKSITTNNYIFGVKQNEWEPFPGRLWQKNYYEHIIRDDDELNRIR